MSRCTNTVSKLFFIKKKKKGKKKSSTGNGKRERDRFVDCHKPATRESSANARSKTVVLMLFLRRVSDAEGDHLILEPVLRYVFAATKS